MLGGWQGSQGRDPACGSLCSTPPGSFHILFVPNTPPVRPLSWTCGVTGLGTDGDGALSKETIPPNSWLP